MVLWDIESLVQVFDSSYTTSGYKIKTIKGIAPLDKGTYTDLSFCSSDGHVGLSAIYGSNSGIILCKKSVEGLIHPKNKNKQAFIFVDNPRLIFIKIIKKMKNTQEPTNSISNNAVISDSSRIGKNCYIGDFVLVGDHCIIGDNTIISSRVGLRNTIIGDNCLVQSGSTIGEDGFAFEREIETSELEKFPHYGKVIIKNNVEIFSNCSIARGSISDTVIGYGTRIDSLCHVAHNVNIGKNTQLTAGTIIGGSTFVGDNCWLGLNCTIKQKLKIGDRSIVGSGSSVIHDVEDEDIVAGAPAKSIKSKVTLEKDELFLMSGQIRKKKLASQLSNIK